MRCVYLLLVAQGLLSLYSMPTATPEQTEQQTSQTVTSEQLIWPITVELTEEKKGMVSGTAIPVFYAKAEQTCKAIDELLKSLEQTTKLLKDSTNQKLDTSTNAAQLMHIDIGKLMELFNTQRKK